MKDMSKTYIPQTQIIDVTLLQTGDFFYPVLQATGERYIEDGMSYVFEAPRIDHNNGSIVVVTEAGPINYQNGAQVAREVPA
jgi:hypothetical protein